MNSPTVKKRKTITSIRAVQTRDGKEFTWTQFASAEMLDQIKREGGLKITHINGVPLPRKKNKMSKYMITADVPATVYKIVEADDPEAALDKVSRYDTDWILSDGGLQPDGASDYTVTEVEE